MSIYYLFLDELKQNKYYNHFCLGGCIIEDETYRKEVIPFVNKLKNDVFGNTTVILHENEVSGKNKEFKILKNKDKNNMLWNGLKDLFNKNWMLTMCVAIDYPSYQNIYKKKSQIKNSEYYVAMQIILENYIHFLEENNGHGAVYIESRGVYDDQRLENHYNLVKSNGTLYFDKEVFQERLKTISFPMKEDNSIGIQIADFIPNPVARYLKIGGEQKILNLFSEISNSLYDGNLSLVNRFGIKKVL